MEQPPVQVFADDARIRVLTDYTDHVEQLVHVYTDAVAASVLDRSPAPDAWSVAQIVHHLADYELVHSRALRRILVEDVPTLAAWDQDAYAETLQYDVRPPEDALTLVLALRHLDSRLLASLSPQAWVRTAMTAAGVEVDLESVAQAASDHLASHVLQGRRAVIGMI
ncbi:MAG TPA: DinB family protein [Candidatus Nanopelagicales bacterium]